MANKIDLIVKYSTEAFDEVYKADARSSLLDGNKKLMQFTGAKTVKIAKFTSDGLSDYSRANSEVSGDFTHGTGHGNGYGYQRADMGISWEEFTLAVDRGAQYRVDLFDNEETAELAVGLGTKQINKQVIIPEVDAYCFSKVAGYVPEGNIITGTNEVIANPVTQLNALILKLDEAEVPSEDQIIFASPAFMQALRNSSENGIVKPLLQSDMKKNVSFLIEEYEGRPIVMVPPSRFMTSIELFSKGFGPKTAVSKKIHCMLVAKEAVYHIVKYNKIKVFGPEVVQDYDGYKINARIYHDVFVPDNKTVAIAMYVAGSTVVPAGVAASVKLTAATAAGTGAHKTDITGITIVENGSNVLPGDLYYVSSAAAGFTAYNADNGWKLGAAVSGITGATKWTGEEASDVTLATSGDNADKLMVLLTTRTGYVIGVNIIDATVGS